MKKKLNEEQQIRKMVKEEIKNVVSEVIDLTEKRSFTKFIKDHNMELSDLAKDHKKDDLINFVEKARALAKDGRYHISDSYLDGVVDVIKTSSFKIGFASLYNRYLTGTGNSVVKL